MQECDNELIARFLTDGDEAAFSCLLKQYQSPIRQFLRRLTIGDHALADDLAQETFVKMYRGLSTFRGDAKLNTWLHKIAYHCFLRYRQQSKIETELCEYATIDFEQQATTDIMVEQMMIHLSIEERVTLTLSYAAGMSHGEIAEVTGVPLGTVKSHITRGKSKLSKRFGKEDNAA